MHSIKKLFVVLLVALIGGLLFSSIALAAQGNGWTTAGGDRQNTRFQKSEHKLSVSNVGDLAVKWVLETGDDVSATPAVDGDTVYVPDWAGNLYAVDKLT
ncbi:MAG: PQQ-binding-like beta-propeller repeat protein, partial [Candidatus Promineifilaceae bacterium]